MSGQILQVNVSSGGVPKRPITEGRVTTSGIEGDSWAHPQYHGGPKQAVLVITSEVIEELAAAGFQVFPGALGENLTTRGVDRRQFRIGQRWRAGTAILELTKIRRPCNTIEVWGDGIGRAIFDAATKAGDVTSERWAMSGVYARVLEEGTVRPGDALTLIEEVA